MPPKPGAYRPSARSAPRDSAKTATIPPPRRAAAPRRAASEGASPEFEAAVEAARRRIQADMSRLPETFQRLHLQTLAAVRDGVKMAFRLIRAASEATLGGAVESDVTALRHAALALQGSATGLVSAMAMSAPARSLAAAPKAQSEQEIFQAGYAALTRQQRVVLALICEGHANKVIAYQLGIRESTVKAHVSRILLTLRTPSRARLIASMLRYGEAEAG